MPRGRVPVVAVVCLGSVLAANVARSQSLIPRGGELQINGYTTDKQYSVTVAAESNGDFVVVWESTGQDGSLSGIFARRYSSAGAAKAGEFQVNTYTTYGQNAPSVALDSDGDFVIAWSSYYQDGATGVVARRFSSSGIALDSEFRVNTYTPSDQVDPAVAAAPGGDFVVAWSSLDQDGFGMGIFGRRFDSSGSPIAGEFQVNAYTNFSQLYPAVAVEADGDFVIAWQGGFQDGFNAGIFARRFSSAGIPVASEFQVNSYFLYDQAHPSVAAHADGGFAVAWQSSQTQSTYEVFARRYSSAGVSLAAELKVNGNGTYQRFSPSIAAGTAGTFVVVWSSSGEDGSPYSAGVFARRLSSTGEPVGHELQVNTVTAFNQQNAAVAADGDGDFVVAWESLEQDGSEYGIFAQRLATPAVLDIDANGSTGALTDGLLILRYLFGFTGNTLVVGAVDLAACARCDAQAIEAYLATLI